MLRRSARVQLSAGLFDYVINFAQASRLWMLLPIGYGLVDEMDKLDEVDDTDFARPRSSESSHER